jgi:hypothetical protein
MTEPASAPKPQPSVAGWETEHGVTCVICPECCFVFSAEHANADMTYTCPLCELQALGVQPAAGSAALREAAQCVVDCWGVGSLNVEAMTEFVNDLRAALSAQTPDTRRAEPPHGAVWCGTCHCWYPPDSAHSWGITSSHQHADVRATVTPTQTGADDE